MFESLDKNKNTKINKVGYKQFIINKADKLPTYNPLLDKHANYYYNNQVVKKRLQKLRQALRDRPYKQSNKCYTEIIENKLEQMSYSNKAYKGQPYTTHMKATTPLTDRPKALKQIQTIKEFNRYIKLKKYIKSFSALPQIDKKLQIKEKSTGQLKYFHDTLNRQKDSKTINLIKAMREKLIQTSKNHNNQIKVQQILVKKEEIKIQKRVGHEQFLQFLKKRNQQIRKRQIEQMI